MVVRIKNGIMNHPYIFMFLWVLFFISTLLIFNIQIFYSGDLYMYIQLAQSIMDGGIVYKDAIDTKNIGFILFFSGFYFIYTKFFTTMAYFFIYQALFLTVWYFILSILSYKIVSFVSNKMFGILSSILLITTCATIPQSFFINQPQIALLFHFIYIFVVLKTWKNHGTIHYALYGFLLAVCCIFSTPYIFLTLSIPCLILIEDKNSITLRNINYSKFFVRSFTAFLGFLIGLMPIAVYLYQNNAVADWWFWNFTFATGNYSEVFYGDFNNSIFSYLIKFYLGLASMTFKFIILSIYTLDSIFHAIFVDTFLVLFIFLLYYKIVQRKTVFASEYEHILFILVVFALLSRISLVRPYMSYNIYVFPLVFLTIPTTLTFAKTHFKKNTQRYAINIFIAGILYILGTNIYKITHASSFSETLLTMKDKAYTFQDAFSAYFPRYNGYSKEIAYISLQNPDKTPTVIAYPGALNLYNYNINWKTIYYNVYLNDHEFITKVKDLNPEILLLTKYNVKSLDKTPEYKMFLQKNYKHLIPENNYVLSGNNCILFDNENEVVSLLFTKEKYVVLVRIQDYDTWNVNIPENIDSYPNPIKTFADII